MRSVSRAGSILRDDLVNCMTGLIRRARHAADLDRVFIGKRFGTLEVPDKMVMQQLGRDDPDQGHIVGFSESMAGLKLFREPGHSRRLEKP